MVEFLNQKMLQKSVIIPKNLTAINKAWSVKAQQEARRPLQVFLMTWTERIQILRTETEENIGGHFVVFY